ncbi:MAG: UTP--glucose-1-phosphate uridylyltransferase [Eubacteriales bacterium]
MNYSEACKLLKEHGQSHLLAYYDELDEKSRASLLSQIEKIDWSLLDLLKREEMKVEKGVLSPLGALEIPEIEANREKFESVGIEALKAEKVGAVLLAGGQGTRLGYDGPKGTYPIGVNRELYIFQCLINNMMDVVKRTGAWIPLFIMTSEKNNDATVSFFKEHNYFGYDAGHIRFFIQEMAPSVDYNGKIYLEAKDKISLSPNGNGGWFTSLVKAGYLDQIKAEGIEWLTVFAVDNVCQRINDPAFVGATIASGRECGAKVVAKANPTEKIGVLCLEDGKPSIVEYYEITEDMKNLRDDKGELQYKFGVILNYMFKVSKLEDILKNSMPTHVVEKKIPYLDENGVLRKPTTPNGYKFETLVLDMIHLMDSCLSYEVVREREFAPVKNATGVDSVETARELLKKNGVEI